MVYKTKDGEVNSVDLIIFTTEAGDVDDIFLGEENERCIMNVLVVRPGNGDKIALQDIQGWIDDHTFETNGVIRTMTELSEQMELSGYCRPDIAIGDNVKSNDAEGIVTAVEGANLIVKPSWATDNERLSLPRRECVKM